MSVFPLIVLFIACVDRVVICKYNHIPKRIVYIPVQVVPNIYFVFHYTFLMWIIVIKSVPLCVENNSTSILKLSMHSKSNLKNSSIVWTGFIRGFVNKI